MSYSAWLWVYEHCSMPENDDDPPNPLCPTSSGEYLVLLSLAHHADKNGDNAFPSIKTLHKRTCLSERMVQLHLRALEQRGIISRRHVPGKRTVCYAIIPLLEKWIPKQNPMGEMDCTPEGEIDFTHETDITPAMGEIDITPEVKPITPQGETHYTHRVKQASPPSEHGIELIDELVINKQEGTESAHEGAQGGLRALLAVGISPPAYRDFGAFWQALLTAYPKEGKVDLRVAREIAQDIDPGRWEEVVRGARNYAQSDRVVKHRRTRNLANFLDGEAWLPYVDGPILDPPVEVRDRAAGVLDFVGRAQQHRAQFERDRGLRQ